MEIKHITEEDKKNITVVFVEAVMMPNGELIRFGKTIGFVKEERIFKEVKE